MSAGYELLVYTAEDSWVLLMSSIKGGGQQSLPPELLQLLHSDIG